nr:kinesin-like protein KIF20B [Parasteatoda tepidariorum]
MSACSISSKEEDVEVGETDLFSRFTKQRDNYESLINVVQSRNDQIKESNRQSFLKLAQENSDWTAFAESLRADVNNKKERIACLEETLGLKADEFATNPAETQKRLQKVAETFQQLEEKESNEIEKRMNLIQSQASEILRLHALVNVEERNKIVRRDIL